MLIDFVVTIKVIRWDRTFEKKKCCKHLKFSQILMLKYLYNCAVGVIKKHTADIQQTDLCCRHKILWGGLFPKGKRILVCLKFIHCKNISFNHAAGMVF